MPEILITLFGFMTVLTVAGGLITRKIIAIKNRPKPVPSEFEVHRSKFIETGDPEELAQMEKEMEGF